MWYKKAMEKEDAQELGFETGRQVAEAVIEEDPSLMSNPDKWIEEASETEEHTRSFSPFEFVAHDFNDREEPDSDELWTAYETGVSDGIYSIVYKTKPVTN